MKNSKLRATGGSLTTTVPAEVVSELKARAGMTLRWVREPDGRYRVDVEKDDPILDAADELIERYAPAFAALARSDRDG
jgi:hypothetical protein